MEARSASDFTDSKILNRAAALTSIVPVVLMTLNGLQNNWSPLLQIFCGLMLMFSAACWLGFAMTMRRRVIRTILLVTGVVAGLSGLLTLVVGGIIFSS